MNDIKALLEKIKEQSGDTDAGYLYGVEHSSDTGPGWKALLRFSTDVPPVVLAAKSKAQLKKELQRYLDGEGGQALTVRYHRAQIDLEQQAIRFHERQIEEYENTHSELPAK